MFVVMALIEVGKGRRLVEEHGASSKHEFFLGDFEKALFSVVGVSFGGVAQGIVGFRDFVKDLFRV